MELNIETTFSQLVKKAAQLSGVFDESFEPEVRMADPRFGDFQANGVLPYAKKNGKNPRELAQKLLQVLQDNDEFKSGDFSVEIAGPGFLNFKIAPHYLWKWVHTYRSQDALQTACKQSFGYADKKVIVDYSSPNTAKQMHVGHLRSMIIGEAIQRMLRFCGANVIRDNHLGDWGTQFGILIMAIKEAGYDLDAAHEDPIEDLEQLYKKGSVAFKENDAAKERARAELVKLQNGDPENFKLWEKISEVSWKAFQSIYERMDVEFDQIQGESFYRDKVDRVYQELKDLGIAIESEGASVVFHTEHPRFKEFPFIIRKADGASNYGSTDLATALHHVEFAHADELIYVTDGRQRDHFEQLFLTVEKWFKAKSYPFPKMHHVWFGMVLGEDGKAIKTRSGDPIRLKNLLDEAEERAYQIVAEKNSTLSSDEKKNIARVVGLGAVKYADLSQNRVSDYVFSWDKLLNFDGNTAPYLLYAVARIHSIFAKADVDPTADYSSAAMLETPEEIQLARRITLFVSAMQQSLLELKPHFLCGYLYDLAGDFSTFYTANKVIVEDEAVRNKRLLLSARTLQILKLGLHILGIETLERM